MNELESPYITSAIEETDTKSGFSCGRRPLDDYFARHAFPNHVGDIGRAYVLRKADDADANLPAMPVALIGRLAVDHRAQGKRIGERLLMDALLRVVDAAKLVACLGIIVDAKEEQAAAFYGKYDFVEFTAEGWPRRMFLPIGTARAAFTEG